MAEPIIRVEGPDGELWHDCIEAACEISWDGINIETGEPVQNRQPVKQRHTPEKKGRVRIKRRDER